MELYHPKEISAAFDGVTSRQITDLAEHGIIIPTIDTTGAGIPRYYNSDAVLDIVIASALRGILKPRDFNLKESIADYRKQEGKVFIQINDFVSVCLNIYKVKRAVDLKLKGLRQ